MSFRRHKSPPLGALASVLCSDAGSGWCPGPPGGSRALGMGGAAGLIPAEQMRGWAAHLTARPADSGLNTVPSESRVTGHKATPLADSTQMRPSEAETRTPHSPARSLLGAWTCR